MNINDWETDCPVLVDVCRGDKGEHPERVKCLLDYGADVNIRGKYNLTALHVASREGFDKVIKVLLRYGANINARSDNGKTPLDMAEQAGRNETNAILKAHG